MEIRLTSSEATERFAELLKRVRESGDSFVVEEGGQAVCTIRPADSAKMPTLHDFVEVLQNAPQPDEGFAKDVEAFVAQVNRPAAPESPWDR
jgi:hypothetical protein